MVCPLLIPILAADKNADKEGASNADENENTNKPSFVVRKMNDIVDFYRTPKVKYYTHSVWL